MGVRNSEPAAISKARELRREATLPERLLWNALRPIELPARIRRQVPVSSYVLDFYVPKARLCFEIDGLSHGQRAEQDIERDRFLLEFHDIETIRFAASSVLEDPEEVVGRVYRAICLKLGLPLEA